MTPSSSSHTAVMDQRGFIFALPHLGLPEPEGEWCHLKAAIATTAEALDLLLNDTALQAPLRCEGEVRFPIEFEGALWLLALPEPQSISATVGAPEFFTVKVKRLFPDALEVPRREAPPGCDWAFIPMFVYKDLVGKKKSVHLIFAAGTAMQAKALTQEKSNKKKNKGSSSKKVDQKITKSDVFSGNIFNEEWRRAVTINTMIEETQRGDHIDDSSQLSVTLRVHPADDHDYRSIDYAVVVVSKGDEGEGSTEGEKSWKPLPAGALKPGADRFFVNMVREANGKMPLSKEEWAPGLVV